ncbi:MAG: methionyl-tRNA formyltransferase [Rikenellaceae bacterium]
MEAKELKIVFMGTPEFAVPSLRRLVDEGYNVVGVVTTPDRAAGRGQKIYECDVKVEAMRLGLPILQPEKLRDEEFLEVFAAWDADLAVVIAFRMLPKVVWAAPRLGTFNLHASLLPEYRGAAPINHAIINGDKVSGVTTFLLNEKIDQGAIIAQRRVEIGDRECVGELYERLMNIGPELVVETVERLAAGDVEPMPQEHIDESTLRPAPKIFKQDCVIDWTWGAERIFNFVRGLSPYPAAWCNLVAEDGAATTAKIFEVEYELGGKRFGALAPGEICSDNRSYIAIGCGDGAIVINSIQLAGKRRMATKELLLGFKNIEQYRAK